MIPNSKPREVTSHGLGASANFGISLNDQAHLMKILRDTLYSDKVLAVLREYSSNAWDAHRDAGKPDLPIKVTLPTHLDPTLTIRDFGAGLSQEDVFAVYTQYGASTKRNSDNSVGMLGIGSKSGFAYSDTFTIVSYHGGTKKTYVAALEKSEKGVIDLLHEESCGSETGIAIQMAIKQDDVREFTEKAQKLFVFFKPLPDINVPLPVLPPSQAPLVNGRIYKSGDREGTIGDGWVAVMGCIPYRINLSQLRSHNSKFGTDDEEGISPFLENLSGALYFNIGELEIAASREELKYNDPTKEALIKKFNDLVDEFVTHSLTEIATGNYTSWEKRLRSIVLREMRLPIPKIYKDWMVSTVGFDSKHQPKLFKFVMDGRQTSSVKVSSYTKLILKDDDTRNIRGFHLSYTDILIVREDPNVSWDDVRKELDELLLGAALDGAPIVKLSDMAWAAPWVPASREKRKVDPKHRRKRFRLKLPANHYYSAPWSSNWEIDANPKDEKDVYVLLTNFKVNGYNFYRQFRSNQALGDMFGVPIPNIYGYKSNGTKPIDPKKLVGIPYDTWRTSFLKSVTETPKAREFLSVWRWSTILGDTYYWLSALGKDLNTLKKGLGKTHPVYLFFRNYAIARAKMRKKRSILNNTALDLDVFYGSAKDTIDELEADKQLSELQKKYPLLQKYMLQVLVSEEQPLWITYIKTVDK